jgi:hypothetical protein
MGNEAAVLTLADEIAQFMRNRFRSLLADEPPPVKHPNHWNLQLLIDCEMAVKVILQASQNQGNGPFPSFLFCYH